MRWRAAGRCHNCGEALDEDADAQLCALRRAVNAGGTNPLR